MTITRHELVAFLGPAAEALDADDVDRLMAECDRIDARYPHSDEEPERQAALGAAVAYLLSDTRPDDAGRQLNAARRAQADAMAASQQIAAMAVADGMSEVRAAEATAIDRMTLRKALGKR